MRRISRGMVAEKSAIWLLGRRVGQDPLDVLDEAHAQHLVGLVEHDGLDAREVERAAPQVVHDAARRADDDVHAALAARRSCGAR